jgi:hypothetical protein
MWEVWHSSSSSLFWIGMFMFWMVCINDRIARCWTRRTDILSNVVCCTRGDFLWLFYLCSLCAYFTVLAGFYDISTQKIHNYSEVWRSGIRTALSNKLKKNFAWWRLRSAEVSRVFFCCWVDWEILRAAGEIAVSAGDYGVHQCSMPSLSFP